jgi:hypothetical protein
VNPSDSDAELLSQELDDDDLSGRLAIIQAQLAVLIPEVRMLRRTRWLARGLAVVAVLTIAVGAAGWISYQDQRNQDDDIRADAAAEIEQALVRECQAAVDGNADLRAAFNVIFGNTIRQFSDDQAQLDRFLTAMNGDLAETVPPRDCAEEARVRAEDG